METNHALQIAFAISYMTGTRDDLFAHLLLLPAGNGGRRWCRRPCRGARSGHWGERLRLSSLHFAALYATMSDLSCR